MLAEVISFGGYVKDVKSIIRGRRKPVRLATEQQSVLVQIKTKQRDNAETITNDNPGQQNHGKVVKNKRFGKMYYETAESLELFDTNVKEVKEAVLRGVMAAVKK